MVAKHPLDQPTTAAKHPPEVNSNHRQRRQSIRQNSTAAKHPPKKRGSKASANQRPMRTWQRRGD